VTADISDSEQVSTLQWSVQGRTSGHSAEMLYVGNRPADGIIAVSDRTKGYIRCLTRYAQVERINGKWEY
jgi:hypothetical protein